MLRDGRRGRDHDERERVLPARYHHPRCRHAQWPARAMRGRRRTIVVDVLSDCERTPVLWPRASYHPMMDPPRRGEK